MQIDRRINRCMPLGEQRTRASQNKCDHGDGSAPTERETPKREAKSYRDKCTAEFVPTVCQTCTVIWTTLQLWGSFSIHQPTQGLPLHQQIVAAPAIYRILLQSSTQYMYHYHRVDVVNLYLQWKARRTRRGESNKHVLGYGK